MKIAVMWKKVGRFCFPAQFVALGFVLLSQCSRESEPTATTNSTIPRRIISISPNSTEIIAALGATDRLVAVSDFCLWPSEVKILPHIGGLFDANLEAILKLQPDLVVLRGKNKGVEELCRENGIALFRDRTESFEDIYATLRALGDVLGCPEKAQAAERHMHERLDRISIALAGRPKPRVLVTIARDSTAIASVMTASKGSFVDDMITLAGGKNVFGELSSPYPSVAQEAILLAQPEVIIEAMPEVKLTPEMESRLRDQWKPFAHVPAVEKGRVYILTDENITIPSPRIVDVIEKLAQILHPEARFD